MLIEAVLRKVATELALVGSSLVADGELEPGVVDTIEDILSETLDRIERPADNQSGVSVLYAVTPEFAAVAQKQALAERHPAEPLMAAEIIFGAALPELAAILPDVDTVRLSTVLHNAIWRRFPPGAIAYVEFILANLARARQDERTAVSRELHDRVAHQLAIGLQHIDLALASKPTKDIRRHLTESSRAISNSFADVQDIATVLRASVGDRSLFDAIEEFVDRLPPSPTVRLSTVGRPHVLLLSIAEEVFSVVMEGVRNARRHAKAREVRIELTWGNAELRVDVRDDGLGFDTMDARSASSGLNVMRERAQIIGARLLIEQDSLGTTVSLRLPLGRATEKT